MKKNSTLKLVLAIIGGVVVVGSIAVAMIHFWDDLKKLLGKGSYPVYIDLSSPSYNITNVYFLEDVKNVIQL